MAKPSHNEMATGNEAHHIAIPPPPPTDYKQFLTDRRRFPVAFFGFMIVFLFFIWLIPLISLSDNNPYSPEFRVDSAFLTSLNVTGPNLTATWDINLVVTNPNSKFNISYDTVSARVFYSKNYGLTLASTHLPPFLQQKNNETMLSLQFMVVNEFVDKRVAKGIAADQVHGLVKFGVSLFAWIRFIGPLPNASMWQFNCDDVRFVFPPNNTPSTSMRGLKCDIVL